MSILAIIAIIALLVLIAACISSIENDQPARAISRKQSRAKTDLRDALHLMRRRK